MNYLTALSPLDGRYAKQVEPLTSIMSEYGLIYYRLAVEIHWLIALSDHKEIKFASPLNSEQKKQLNQILNDFSIEDAEKIKQIEQTTNHDVKSVEYFLREKCEAIGLSALIPAIHFACTSADINNVAYALMLQQARKDVLLPAMTQLIETLANMARQYADIPMLSRTHGQPASPTTLGKELANFAYRFKKQKQQFEKIAISAKLNGAVGNFNAHYTALPDCDWKKISQQFIEGLGLEHNPYTTQIEPHDDLAALLQCLMRFNTILIDFNRDTWGYISIHYFHQKKIAGEVGSSTMPHKINPIKFENSEGNLGIANALADHLANKLPISRWQRDLSNSTVLRNLGSVFGYSLLSYQSTTAGLERLEANQEEIAKDLDQHWEVLTEAVQTVMRCHGINDAYEQLKQFSRGEIMTKEKLAAFIQQINLPQEVKNRLLSLTPANYIGKAAELAKE
ncbi:MAG: adenylosuccinate lyase [Gammaproteobacteria bacterium]|nr:adenylosuccinate lyase [Gammaproteobacteria bacterium]MCH9744823.1 adenylosuccinate lyase [Gammaproteobacteria bacterium]